MTERLMPFNIHSVVNPTVIGNVLMFFSVKNLFLTESLKDSQKASKLTRSEGAGVFTLHSPWITVTHHSHKSPTCDLYTSLLAAGTVCSTRGPHLVLFPRENNLTFVLNQDRSRS